MWKKNDTSSAEDNAKNAVQASPAQAVSKKIEPQKPEGIGNNASTKAFIGKSIEVNGEIIGNEDLIVDGKVTGKITLKNHNLKVDREGIVDADIKAKTIDIEGKVYGNITCFDKITIRKNGDVTGDISAYRVILEDGCQFKGGIDMIPSKDAEVTEKKITQADSIGEIKPAINNEIKSSAADFVRSSGNA